MQNTQLPDDTEALNRLYDETVEAHKAYLEKVHNAFDQRCEEIRVAAHKELDALPESDKDGRQKALTQEKIELDQALSELKMALHRSSEDARHTLEDIQAKMEASSVDLERELAQV